MHICEYDHLTFCSCRMQHQEDILKGNISECVCFYVGHAHINICFFVPVSQHCEFGYMIQICLLQI